MILDFMLSKRFVLSASESETAAERLQNILAMVRKELEENLYFAAQPGGEDLHDNLVLEGQGRAFVGSQLDAIRFSALVEVEYCEDDSTVRIGVRGKKILHGWPLLGFTIGMIFSMGYIIAVTKSFLCSGSGLIAMIWLGFVFYGGHIFRGGAPARTIEKILDKVALEFGG